jgi:hypothetical protein
MSDVKNQHSSVNGPAGDTHGLPVVARALDVVAVAGLLVALSPLLAGGFRLTTPIGRLTVESWWRPVVIGLLAAAVRHAIWRRPSLVDRLVTAAGWLRTDEARVVTPVVVGTRIGVLIVGFLGIAMLGYAANTPPYFVYQDDFLNMPARWDTGWFLGIARDGYRFDAAAGDRMQNVAFFPLYPMAMRYGGLVAGGHVLWAGVVVSLASFFWAMVLLYRLARSFVDADAAAMGLALLATYPFALFFSAAYTEALFLLTVVAACHHFERDRLWRAGAWGLAAGLTRPNGCFLSIVLALMAARHWRTAPLPATAGRLLAASAPGLGMVLFSTYMYALTGHPLQWAAQHAAWGRNRGFGAILAEQGEFLQHGVVQYASSRPVDLLHATCIVLMLSGIVPVYRLLGAPYAAWIVLSVVPPLAMGGLLSMGRISAVVFPVFLWLGAAIPAHQRTTWLTGFAMLQALCAIAFFTWRPLY